MKLLKPQLRTFHGDLTPIASHRIDEQAWLDARQQLLTASQVAGWAGWSPYEIDSRPISRFSPNWRNVRIGQMLEDDVLEELADARQDLTIAHNADGHLYGHPNDEHLAATPDAIAWTDGNDLPTMTIQVKTTTGSWGGVPPPWIQIQAAAEAYVLGTDQYCVAWYEADLRRFATFHWRAYRTAESIKLSKTTRLDIRAVLATAVGNWAFGDPPQKSSEDNVVSTHEAEAIDIYRKYKRLSKRLADREKMAKKVLESLFPEDGEYHNLDNELVLTRRTQTSRRFDTKAFREANADTWDEYRKETNTTFFQV